MESQADTLTPPYTRMSSDYPPTAAEESHTPAAASSSGSGQNGNIDVARTGSKFDSPLAADSLLPTADRVNHRDDDDPEDNPETRLAPKNSHLNDSARDEPQVNTHNTHSEQ